MNHYWTVMSGAFFGISLCFAFNALGNKDYGWAAFGILLSIVFRIAAYRMISRCVEEAIMGKRK